jgi:hypothetical protein
MPPAQHTAATAVTTAAPAPAVGARDADASRASGNFFFLDYFFFYNFIYI